MPNLKDIRRRIVSVRKTQQITSAMRMVSAAKLRRAQDAIVAVRPYAERMGQTLADVVRGQTEAEHPLLEPREAVASLELLVIASDRGLCGAFNANLLKAAEAELAEREPQRVRVGLTLVGRKAAEYFRRRRREQIVEVVTGIARVEYGHAVALADHVRERFQSGTVDEVVIVYSEFVSAMSQRPRRERLLPVSAGPDEERSMEEGSLPYEIEPSPEKLLQVLVPKALEVQIHRALLESQAGEHAARMAAMESATRNTEEMIDSLALQYNRARQAAITKELVEIVSGAEAL